jgi:hypothetical protein
MKVFKTAVFAGLLGAATAFAQPPAGPAEPHNTVETQDDKWPEFRTLDTNGDGQLSRDEASAHPEVAKQFDSLDTDKDGMLSEAEYAKGKPKQPMEGQS